MILAVEAVAQAIGRSKKSLSTPQTKDVRAEDAFSLSKKVLTSSEIFA